MSEVSFSELENIAAKTRRLVVDVCYRNRGAHIGSCLSAADLIVYLLFSELNINKENQDAPFRDRLILSKGHAGLAYAAAASIKGLIKEEELFTFNALKSRISVHLDGNKLPFVDASTGSLGHGEGIALGYALGYKMQGKDCKVVSLLGDGELNEGSCWEAFSAINQFNATNLITVIDRNRLMLDGKTEDIMSVSPLSDRLSAFGLNPIICNGHSFSEIAAAFAAAEIYSKPSVIIANTTKGEGVNFMENDAKWHYGEITEEDYVTAVALLDEYNLRRAAK